MVDVVPTAAEIAVDVGVPAAVVAIVEDAAPAAVVADITAVAADGDGGRQLLAANYWQLANLIHCLTQLLAASYWLLANSNHCLKE